MGSVLATGAERRRLTRRTGGRYFEMVKTKHIRGGVYGTDVWPARMLKRLSRRLLSKAVCLQIKKRLLGRRLGSVRGRAS